VDSPNTKLFILDKKEYNKNITNLPEIHAINLERRQDRKYKMMTSASGVPLTFFKAIDGRKLTMTPEIEQLFKGNDFAFRKGVIGAALSHYTLWKQFVNSDKQEILIIEDDVEFASDFMSKYSYAYDQIQNIKDWDILYLGWSLFESQKRGMENDLWNNDYPDVVPFDNKKFYGAGFFGYLLSKRGAQKLLNHISIKGITRAIDCIPLQIPTLNKYFMFPHIIKTPVYEVNSNVDTDIHNDHSTLLLK
jgi:GR25 family glycosyltransferase involved in LPS biosynthesis